MTPRLPKPPMCTRCSQPAANVTGRGEYTGQHTDIDECLRRMGFRIAALEATLAGLFGIMESGACPYCRKPDVCVGRNLIGDHFIAHNLKMPDGKRRRCPASRLLFGAALRTVGQVEAPR